MSTTPSKPDATDQEQTDEDETSFQYVTTTTPNVGDHDSRHDAIGVLAKYGDWENGDVVPITENCLVRFQQGPRHLGDQYFGDRDYLATKHGAVRIDKESVVRQWNGEVQEVVEAHWHIECPICYHTHISSTGDEEGRQEVIDDVLDCCDTEWFPPSDWVADCSICNSSHRGEFGCLPPGYRDPFPGLAVDYQCHPCDWEGKGGELDGPDGRCPSCGSSALEETPNE